jgi:hypothetical protein
MARIGPTELEAVLESAGEDTERYRLHSARVGSTELVNVQWMSEKERYPWLVLRATPHGDNVLQLQVAKDEPFNDARTSTPQEVLAKALKRGDLFQELLVCVRADLPPSPPPPPSK